MSRCAVNISWKRGQVAEFSLTVHFSGRNLAPIMRNAILLPLAAATLVVPAHAKKPEPYVWPELGVETRIVFPNYGAIRNFEADGNDGIWLEDRQRRWYYGEIIGSCPDLKFANSIGFDTRGAPSFDKFSSIIVRGDKCQLTSLVTAEKPLSRKEREKLRKSAIMAGKQAVAPSN
jgi:Family of unknown function (DUF6491)